MAPRGGLEHTHIRDTGINKHEKKHSGPNEATDKPMLQIEHSSLLELPTQQHQAVD